MIRRPGFAAVAIVTLALGLGVNTAIFTIANTLAAQELPVQDPSALYRLGDDANCCVNSGLQDNYSLFATQLDEHLRDSAPEFQSLAGFQANVSATSVRRGGTSITESIPSQFVSGNYFQTLGVSPHLLTAPVARRAAAERARVCAQDQAYVADNDAGGVARRFVL